MALVSFSLLVRGAHGDAVRALIADTVTLFDASTTEPSTGQATDRVRGIIGVPLGAVSLSAVRFSATEIDFARDGI